MTKSAPLVALAYMALLSCSSFDKDTAAAALHRPEVVHQRLAPRLSTSRGDSSGRVVIVAIDGARWQEIFGGTDAALIAKEGAKVDAETADQLVPNISELGHKGVALGRHAEDAFEASGPNFVSLPGYTEILTGRPAPCQENACEARPDTTLADEVRAMPGVGRNDVAVISSWERIDAVASGSPENVIVSAGRTHGETREVLADDAATGRLLHSGAHDGASPGHDDYRPDRDTIAIATSYFQRETPRFMFVSLGDTDEYAHAGNYAGYIDALKRADAFVGALVRVARSSGREDVSFFVTADHGRSFSFRDHGRDYPESARTWLVAGGRGLAASDLAPPSRAHLRDIAPTVRELLGLPGDSDRLAGAPLTEVFAANGSCLAMRD